MDVLFLSVSAGGGHLKAAECLKEFIEMKCPDSRIMIVDTLKYINPLINKVIIGSYLNTVKSTPKIYGKLYDLAESTDNLSDISKTINKILSFKIKNLIIEFKPDIIVCTHPFPLQMLTSLKKKGMVKVPAVAILTDFAVHSFWLYEHIDAYVVAHPSMKHEMACRGIPDDIIYPFGIPVSHRFLQENNRSQILESLGLEHKTTILIMGGSLGFGDIREVFLSLLMSQREIQIIAVTGKNVKLKRQLEKWSSESEKKVTIFSYTDRIADLMAVSDLLFTKPGGMTISEALVMHLPMVIISPIPGQEEKNAQFLLNSGVAARIGASENVESLMIQLLDNPMRIRHMKEIAANLSKPNACEDIYNLFLKLMK